MTHIIPYYQDDFVTIYHADCMDIIPKLGKFDLLLTDPPYGIGMDKGVKPTGYGFGGKRKYSRIYKDEWDKSRPMKEIFDLCLSHSDICIIWGGSFFTDMLPCNGKWLVWDKINTLPTFSDAELAWTNLSGTSIKIKRYCNNGYFAVEMARYHPTQKPLGLMAWCITVAGNVQTILDPFAGVGTTGRAAKNLGKMAVLIEREEKYCELSANRMRQECFDLMEGNINTPVGVMNYPIEYR